MRFAAASLLVLLLASLVLAQYIVPPQTAIIKTTDHTATNAALKDTGMYLQYVSPRGNDLNDGHSWGTAKQTIWKAMLSLPGADASTSGQGTIYVADGSAVGNPVAGFGINLIGANDAYYSNPPTGWLRAPYYGSLKISGYDANVGPSNSFESVVRIIGCNGQGANAAPCVWLATVYGFVMENIAWPNYGQAPYAIIGTYRPASSWASAVHEPHVSSGVTLRNVAGNYGGQRTGIGPCIEAWGYFFVFDRISCGGADPVQTIAAGAAVRNNNSVTITLSAPNSYYIGEFVTYYAPTDTTFSGNFAVTAVTANTVSWAQTGPNATTGGGYTWSDKSFAISLNMAGVDTKITMLTTGSGGVRLTENGGACDVVMDLLSGDSIYVTPPLVEFVGGYSGECGATITGSSYSDRPGVGPDVLNWGRADVTVNGVNNVIGAANVVNVSSHTANASNTGAAAQGQSGFFLGQVMGQEDAARRLFSPTAARFSNLVAQNPASWGDSASGYGPGISRGTLTTGLLAPDGTSGAASYISNPTAGNSFLYLYGTRGTLTLGDTWVGGMWVRYPDYSTNSNSASFVQFGVNGLGYGQGDYCYGGTQGSRNGPYEMGDGQWFWVTVACTIWTNPSSAGIGFGVHADSSHHIWVYAPVLYRIPSGTLSGSEMAEFVRDLAPQSAQAVAGDVAPLPGQRFGVTSASQSNTNLVYLLHNSTSNGQKFVFQDLGGAGISANVPVGTSCAMSGGTTCTARVPSTAHKCVATLQSTSATTIVANCSITSTTATVTAASSNSGTWGVVAF